ncbi:hypothetical protein CPB84DRAFT_1675984 [Gymnopilus junonius]|uniref:F-box domain-containing protein n=1 Tax=Gymnopilus junonius TaxID=109634 RepID=A0A9P5TRS8_GYMJU|nr:hypothetical protein CPB84DRAFT_1675984 [Gymnopilus junonius]
MHPALLIDEILRLIFSFCLECDRKSLLSAARTCKAWKDPALDFIWSRLSSPEPLLLQAYVDRTTFGDLLIFDSYARRVKHLTNRQDTRMKPVLMTSSETPQCNLALPNLVTAQISIPKYSTFSLPFILSPNLARLDVDLGFKTRASKTDSTLCSYLECAVTNCPSLCHVSFRGLASRHINSVISSMRCISSIYLRLGRSLLPETLQAILMLPRLEELEIHAGHIDIDDLQPVFECPSHSLLPSLNKLHIRAKSSLIEKVLQSVQPDTLYHLHIELEDLLPRDSNWTTVFRHICSRASRTLRHLALEHHFEVSETSTSSMGATPTSHHTFIPSPMSSETLQMLNNLRTLRHFSCDITLPAAISDKVVERLVTWWPDLEHLEFGCAPLAEDQQMGVAQITAASLTLFAAKCTKLKRLILPLTIQDPLPSCVAQIPTSSQLRNLTIARLKTTDPLKVAEYLHTLFPALQDLAGPFDDSEPWIATKHALTEIGPSLIS